MLRELLIKARIDSGLTIRELANLVAKRTGRSSEGVRTTIHRYEAEGGPEPRTRTLEDVLGALEAELRTQLAEPALRLHVGGCVLDLEDAALHRGLLQLAVGLGLGVASLDLLLHLVERGHIVAHGLLQLSHRRVHLLLHLGLVELRQQLLLLGELLLQQTTVLLHGGLGLIGRLGGVDDHRLQAFHVALDLDELVGDALGRSVVLSGLGGVAALVCVGGHDERLARRGVELLQLGHLGVEAQLGLLLAGDHVGRLLLEPSVLVLSLTQRLLELHCRIRVLVEVAVELRAEVLPPLLEQLEHARQLTAPPSPVLTATAAMAGTVCAVLRSRVPAG